MAEEPEVLERDLNQTIVGLSEDEKAQLSRVLFPETDIATIQILGVQRTLRPVTLKYAKAINAATAPTSLEIQAAMSDPKVGQSKNLDDQVIASLVSTGRILSDFYGWKDVRDAIDEEDILLGELQGLATLQVALNGNNDFLLASLRTVVRTMKLLEVLSLKFQSMLTTLQSSKSGTAASMSSSPSTPSDS